MVTILVVDDAEFLRLRVTKMLMRSGYQVAQAENGVNAVSLYQSLHPDAVLMDITMPEMDGLTALKTIRAADPCARVVMLSALGQEEVIAEALQCGAKDFITKPFGAECVLSALNKAFS